MLVFTAINSCNTSRDWNEINSVVINQNVSLNFEAANFEDILKDSQSVELDPILFKKMIIHSKSEGYNYIVKGGFMDAIVLFNDSTEMKIGLSMNYGIFKILETDETFSTSENGMNANRWFDIKK